MDTDFSIHHIDAPEATTPIQQVRATESVNSTQFVQRSTVNGPRSSNAPAFAHQSGRAGLRAFEANTEYNPVLHASSQTAPTPYAGNQPNATTRADRNMMAALMSSQTLAQQQSTQSPETQTYVARRYSDVVKASEAAAVAALRTSPDGGRGQQQQQQEEAEQETYAPPTVSLASSIAKKEWMRCISGTPRPMRPTTPLPKLG